MQIDILSDLHINSWSKHLLPDGKEVRRIWEPLKPKGEVLIVAGDIGEIPLQNANFLKTLKKLYYKEIVCVLGNHDLHCLYNRTIYLYDGGTGNYCNTLDGRITKANFPKPKHSLKMPAFISLTAML